MADRLRESLLKCYESALSDDAEEVAESHGDEKVGSDIAAESSEDHISDENVEDEGMEEKGKGKGKEKASGDNDVGEGDDSDSGVQKGLSKVSLEAAALGKHSIDRILVEPHGFRPCTHPPFNNSNTSDHHHPHHVVCRGPEAVFPLRTRNDDRNTLSRSIVIYDLFFRIHRNAFSF